MNGDLAQAAAPAIDTLAQTILGSIIVVLTVVCILAIYTLIKVQNARVADQKEMSERVERLHFKMVEAFGGFQTALMNLEKAEDSSQKAVQFLRDQIVAVSSKVEACPKRRGI